MGMISYGSPMAGNFWRAIWAWLICFGVTILISFLTAPKRDEELEGIVYGMTERKEAVERTWYKKPWVLAVVALAITIVLNIIFF